MIRSCNCANSACTRSSATPFEAQYSANSSPGERSAWFTVGRAGLTVDGEFRVDADLEGVGQRVGDGLPKSGAGRLFHVHPEVVVTEFVGAGHEFGDGAVHGPQPPAGGDRYVGDLGRRRRGGLHQADDVDVVLLAEVHRERGPAVHDGARCGQRLPPVQMTERHVMRARPGKRWPAREYSKIDCAARSPPPNFPPVTVRCAITTLTASGVNDSARLASTSRTMSS